MYFLKQHLLYAQYHVFEFFINNNNNYECIKRYLTFYLIATYITYDYSFYAQVELRNVFYT